jgi:diguanylate cyclase (GGDEF)-like protein
LATARRAGTPVSLLLLDVDRFKQYNDTFGHPAGDDVLRRTAALIRSVVRESDLPARYGGEEFAVVLPGADVWAAQETAERVRAAMAEHPWPHAEVTVSIGVACAIGAVEAGALIEAADRALYLSKSGGRDRVSVAGEVAAGVRPAA